MPTSSISHTIFHLSLNENFTFQQPAIDIMSAVLNNPSCTGYTWYPTIEQDFGQIRYLEDEPDKLFANGNFSKVPVLIGIAADEFVERVPG